MKQITVDVVLRCHRTAILSTPEGEGEGSQIPGQSGPLSNTLFKKKKKNVVFWLGK